MAARQRLGEILIDNKLVSEQDIKQAVRIQIGSNKRLGHILVRMGVISADQLAETLAEQLGMSICSISEHITPEAKNILPRHLCKKYGVLPLKQEENNVILLAMANPSDIEARNDIENYTGKVVDPVLMKYSDIDNSINKFVPLRMGDLFSNYYNTKIAKLGFAVSMCLILLLSGITYSYINKTTYGTKSLTKTSTIYKNHDLMVGIENNGEIYLFGRGAYARGYYSVSFANPLIFESFILTKQEDLSDKQKDWLSWIIQKVPDTAPQAITANN